MKKEFHSHRKTASIRTEKYPSLKIASPSHLDLINVARKDLNAGWAPCLSPSRPRLLFSGEQSVSVPWEIVTALQSATQMTTSLDLRSLSH